MAENARADRYIILKIMKFCFLCSSAQRMETACSDKKLQAYRNQTEGKDVDQIWHYEIGGT